MSVVSADFSQTKKREDGDYPKIPELVLEVAAKSASTGRVRKEYKNFLLAWRGQYRYGYAEIYENDFFTYRGSSHHMIDYESISLGVLPHDGHFYQFAKLDMPLQPKTAKFYHDTRNVLIQYGHFEMTFSYDNIRTIYMNIKKLSRHVYFDLINPPIIKRIEPASEQHPKPLKYRNLNMSDPRCEEYSQGYLEDIDVLGRSNILCLKSKSSKLGAIVSNIHYKCGEKSVYFSDITTVERTKPKDPVLPDMDFDCAYLLTAIFQRNFTVVLQAATHWGHIDHTLKRLNFLGRENAAYLVRALAYVLSALDSGEIVDYWRVLWQMFEHYAIHGSDEADTRDSIVPPNCCKVRRVTVTPTRRLLWPKTVMNANCIPKNFDSEYALRISFQDDDMCMLTSRSYTGLLESCTLVLRRSGLLIGSRKYEFLNMSNSQVRGHWNWMYSMGQKGNRHIGGHPTVDRGLLENSERVQVQDPNGAVVLVDGGHHLGTPPLGARADGTRTRSRRHVERPSLLLLGRSVKNLDGTGCRGSKQGSEPDFRIVAVSEKDVDDESKEEGSELNFRIVAVSKVDVDDESKEELRKSVVLALRACRMSVVTADFLQTKKTEDADYPKIAELVLEVAAKSASTGRVRLEYKKFLLAWRGQYRYAYAEIYESDFFTYRGSSHHMINYESISLGVLPHDGHFYQFAKLDMPLQPKTAEFYHDTRNVLIQYGHFEMTFSYDNIRTIYMNIENQPRQIYFDLINPPIITRIEPASEQKPYPLKHRNLNMSDPRCEEYNQGYLEDIDVLGRSNILCLTVKSSSKLKVIVSNIHYKCGEKSVYFSDITTVARTKPKDPVLPYMDFDCAYLLTAIFQRNFTVVLQAADIDHTLERLRILGQQGATSLERALGNVLSALDSGNIVDYWRALWQQYEHYALRRSDEVNIRDSIVPPNCCKVRKVTVTPTRRLLWPKEVMHGNRILRNFDSEYALRVSLRDDDMCMLSSRSEFGVLNSCTRVLRSSDLRIGSRKYEFLGWSNSQLRDHRMWMYARDKKGKTSAAIRKWMGDFSKIRNVPKYMARMGQCFSQTEGTVWVPLHPPLVRTETDVELTWDGKPYCFSDGVGRISMKLAARIHTALGHDKLCSAFQIRYGGFKGMLVTDPNLKYAQIAFRNSMKKFDCPNSTQLEIAKTSAPIPLQLNRPFISLLNGLGVPDSAFLRLQEKVLQKLTTILYDEEEAATFLKEKTPFNTPYEYQELSASGIHLTTDPFFKSILLTLHRHFIEKIKDKANIPIDPDKGRNMIGVIDEYGKLSYGQVFVQYTKDISYRETTKDTVIVTGEVLVTKNPCMHPGDVRKFQAVNVPALHHIVDCIVFPRKGPRPHPNEMAGSDLDGDEYAVLWCPELIFEGLNRKPADFEAQHSEDVPKITVNHMINFLIKYIQNDQVGQIASAHLAHADREGIDSKVCLDIAKKFSVAVDFAKNGRYAHLDWSEKPSHYPDFMENYNREVYQSEKALGSIYRICKDFESENQAISVAYEDVKVDPDLVYTGWELYKESATKSKNKYCAELRSLLRTFGIQHEAEAMSGAFPNLRERKDRYWIERVIIGCIKRLNKSILEEFNEVLQGSSDIRSIRRKIFQKASAWYVVTYSDPKAKFLSFPWIVSEYLTLIKISRTGDKQSALPPAIVNLDTTIADWESKNMLPEYVESDIWNQCSFACSPRIVKKALRTLILWAEDVEILDKRQGRSGKGLMLLSVFVELFLHVAEQFGYVSRSAGVNNPPKHFSAGQLCIEFLKYCSNFRFYDKEEITSLLKFRLHRHDVLAKRAIVYFHNFALTGQLQSLNVDKHMDDGLIDMKPVVIESKIFSGSPIDRESLRNAEDALMKHSKVKSLKLRENVQMKIVYVSATGTELAIKELKSILGENHKVLCRLFNSGVLSET